ncbi:hypothetical protein AGR7C_Cc150033 [Agrobacterium deltaense Zutra 3/1]|uniref:Uncharacterized protein n=1 Tax=Agrobacterium deltaense Zutra 3/1 TaxID=1183427 RepID=A0A1S7PED5_9HYPH|nr:hypothetical protein AGR7C_Cc150033 [Agrobacterium deltaense Zutra 3/1]
MVMAISEVFSLRSWRFSKIISKEIQNSSRPPAMRNAPSEMPRRLRMARPKSAKTARMPKAMMEPRSATWLRWSRVMPAVSARKTGARPGGSSVTRSVVSALMSVSLLAILSPSHLFLGRSLRKSLAL